MWQGLAWNLPCGSSQKPLVMCLRAGTRGEVEGKAGEERQGTQALFPDPLSSLGPHPLSCSRALWPWGHMPWGLVSSQEPTGASSQGPLDLKGPKDKVGTLLSPPHLPLPPLRPPAVYGPHLLPSPLLCEVNQGSRWNLCPRLLLIPQPHALPVEISGSGISPGVHSHTLSAGSSPELGQLGSCRAQQGPWMKEAAQCLAQRQALAKTRGAQIHNSDAP